MNAEKLIMHELLSKIMAQTNAPLEMLSPEEMTDLIERLTQQFLISKK